MDNPGPDNRKSHLIVQYQNTGECLLANKSPQSEQFSHTMEQELKYSSWHTVLGMIKPTRPQFIFGDGDHNDKTYRAGENPFEHGVE